jgi:CHAT domain-containing protein/tetratricopeptide (TPR) repeat protein
MALLLAGVFISAMTGSAVPADTGEIRRLIEVSDSLSEICNFAEALASAERLVETAEADSKIEDTIRAWAHEVLGERLLEWGYYDQCQEHFDRSLSILENTLDDAKEAEFRLRLLQADLQMTRERFEEARKWLEPLMESAETGDGLPYSLLSRCQYLMARMKKIEVDFDEAERWYRLAIETESRYTVPSELQLAGYFTDLARLHLLKGRLDQSDSVLAQAFELFRTTVKPCHPGFVVWMLNKASLHQKRAEFEAADSLTSAAISALESGFGPEHPDMVNLLNYQSKLYWIMGRYEENVRISRRALEIARSVYGDTSKSVASVLNNLGSAYWALGRFKDAAECFEQGLEIYEALPGDNDKYTTRLVNNLGAAYRKLGRLEESEKMYIRSLLLRRKLFGPDHADVAKALNNLSKVYADQGKTEEAQTTLLEAISIWKRALGPNHPDVAIALKNLGDLYFRCGLYNDALNPYRRSYDVWLQVYGPGHSNLSHSLTGLARVFGALGQIDSSSVYYEKLLKQQYRFVDYAFSFSSESQKLQCLKEYPLIDHSLLTLTLRTGDPQLERISFEMVLKGKAVVVDVMRSKLRAAICSVDGSMDPLLEEHQYLCDQIANLALGPTARRTGEKLQDSLRTLYRLLDGAESELSRRCSAFGDALAARRFQIEDVADRLGKGAVLWEYIRYRPFAFDSIGTTQARTLDERYLVFVMNEFGQVKLFDLGECERIDSLIVETKRQIEDGAKYVFSPLGAELEGRLAETTGMLFDLLVKAPLENSKPATTIYVSPDGPLNLLPLEILPVSHNRYLVEEAAIYYLTTGRDLLAPVKKPRTGGLAAIFADPDFDAEVPDNSEDGSNSFTVKPMDISQSESIPDACIPKELPQLPSTRAEGDAISRLLQSAGGRYNVEEFYGYRASKASLMGLSQSPIILHVATHGFFCHSADAVLRQTHDQSLLRSGLALAGANRTASGTESPIGEGENRDGIITSLELSGLNLTETELVILSACETGSGNPMAGEGVFGLRRAFQLAGARSILLSLWAIPDHETIDLVEMFYRKWLPGRSKAEALREATLAGLNRSRRELGSGHPYTWGAFILVGQPD